ncbi:MAG: hypothetical protein E7201_02845 [Selenomonas ruminantium]|uniref:Uncharacterized protein n=1 Tax=Selenomonas ruminantium TaxID=971 RepID=A0A928A0T7_SELRU|nr:hypothetical protein [Selenomonas ruminantium]
MGFWDAVGNIAGALIEAGQREQDRLRGEVRESARLSDRELESRLSSRNVSNRDKAVAKFILEKRHGK